MQHLLTALVDLIFPPRPTQKILDETKRCLKQIPYQPSTYKDCLYLSSYQNSLTQAAIVENKFYRNKYASILLSNLFIQWIKTQTAPTLYIPIPLGSKRLKSRGYNQIENVLKEVNIHIDTETKLLTRKIDTEPQSKLKKQERLENIKDAFHYHGDDFDFSEFSQVIIVDDVITTGTTLKEARATLAPHLPSHIKLICLAFSH